MNIPIFRAKTKSKDGYIEGIVSPDGNFIIVEIKVKKAISQIVITEAYEIDPTTLSIHFPDMLDSQGNKIFASLCENGKGGDICYVRDFSYGYLQGVARYENNYFRIHRKGKAMGISLKCRDIKVIGIQE